MPAVPIRFINPQPSGSLAPAWTSGNLTWAAGTAQAVNHTLGRKPYIVRPVWICSTAHIVSGVSYAVGNEMAADLFLDQAGNPYNISIFLISPTQIGFTPYIINSLIGGVYPAANWRVKIDLW